nr:dihydrodipicolinate synthase family protein [Desulfurococcales archaeon]
MGVSSLLDRALHGLVAAMVTPYRGDLTVDLDAAGELAGWLADGGVDGVLVAGTTGELGLLRPSEVAALAGRVSEVVGGRAAVIAGVRGENPWQAAEAARAAVDSGADAVLVPPPCYHRTGPEGLLQFYSRLADAVDAPVIVYNIPSRTRVEVPPEVVGRLAGEHS